MEPYPPTRSETRPASRSEPVSEPDRPFGPGPRVREMIAVLLRVGLGVCLLNGGLLGYIAARRGGNSASSLVWSTLLGPSSVASVLEHDLLVPFVQIALGLALILGLFTVASAVLSGFLIVSGPIFQFLAVLSQVGQPGNPTLELQALMVTTGSVNLLLLVAAVLWITPVEGTPWSLDVLIFSHPRQARGLPSPAPSTTAPDQGATATTDADAGPAAGSTSEVGTSNARGVSLNASRG